MTKVLVFAGSARTGSLNKRFARQAAERIEALGGEATFIDQKISQHDTLIESPWRPRQGE